MFSEWGGPGGFLHGQEFVCEKQKPTGAPGGNGRLSRKTQSFFTGASQRTGMDGGGVLTGQVI